MEVGMEVEVEVSCLWGTAARGLGVCQLEYIIAAIYNASIRPARFAPLLHPKETRASLRHAPQCRARRGGAVRGGAGRGEQRAM